jgi:hypothetical protein
MKRALLIALIVLTMIGLFAANQTRLLAKGAPVASSTSAGETMQTANGLYELGRFAQAAQAYQHLVDQGFTDSSLFYNLGNAYYKQGDYGRAILNFRRAQQLAPRDPDIEANLVLARAQAVDQFEAVDDRSLLSQLGETVQSWLTLNELAMAALAAWILFVFLVILFGTARGRGTSAGSTWRKGLQYALAASVVVLIVGVLALGSTLAADRNLAEGVIVADTVDVTSGPGGQYVAEFTLHGGAEVSLVEMRGSWIRLALPGGEMEGWVPANAVEAVSGQG